MKSLTNRINESIVINEAIEMDFDDVLLELQIMGFKVKENKQDKVYTAKKNGEHDIQIVRLGGDSISVTTSRDSNKEKTKYSHTEFIDDMVTNSL